MVNFLFVIFYGDSQPLVTIHFNCMEEKQHEYFNSFFGLEKQASHADVELQEGK